MKGRQHCAARLPQAREDKSLPPYGFKFNVDIIEKKLARPRTAGAGTGLRPQGYELFGKVLWTVLVPVIRAAPQKKRRAVLRE